MFTEGPDRGGTGSRGRDCAVRASDSRPGDPGSGDWAWPAGYLGGRVRRLPADGVTDPPPTTIASRTGRWRGAVDALVKQIDGAPAEPMTLLNPELIVPGLQRPAPR
jgi:hypothetical protein